MFSGKLESVFLKFTSVTCDGFPSCVVGNIVIGISLLSHFSVHLDAVGFPAAAHLMNAIKIILVDKLLVPVLVCVSYLLIVFKILLQTEISRWDKKSQCPNAKWLLALWPAFLITP